MKGFSYLKLFKAFEPYFRPFLTARRFQVGVRVGRVGNVEAEPRKRGPRHRRVYEGRAVLRHHRVRSSGRPLPLPQEPHRQDLWRRDLDLARGQRRRGRRGGALLQHPAGLVLLDGVEVSLLQWESTSRAETSDLRQNEMQFFPFLMIRLHKHATLKAVQGVSGSFPTLDCQFLADASRTTPTLFLLRGRLSHAKSWSFLSLQHSQADVHGHAGRRRHELLGEHQRGPQGSRGQVRTRKAGQWSPAMLNDETSPFLNKI